MRQIIGLVFCLSLTGCATLFSSEPESINVKSDPPGAKFQYGAFSGTTPANILVPRKALTQYATFRKDGYEEKTVPVMTGTQGVIWWGILFWPSLIVDFVTGNAYKLDPPEINAVLDIQKPGVAESAAIAAIGQSDLADPNLLEKEFQKLIQQLFVGLANQKTLRLAVLPTEHISGSGSKTLSSYMTEKLTYGVYDAKVGRLVERARLVRVMDELQLSHTPTFDDDTAKRIGRMSGADIVIISSYAEIGTKIVEINAKAVSVETGEILGVGTAKLPAETVNRLLY